MKLSIKYVIGDRMGYINWESEYISKCNPYLKEVRDALSKLKRVEGRCGFGFELVDLKFNYISNFITKREYSILNLCSRIGHDECEIWLNELGLKDNEEGYKYFHEFAPAFRKHVGIYHLNYESHNIIA